MNDPQYQFLKSDKILFIELPPVFFSDDVAIPRKGVNYMRGYLESNGFETGAFMFTYPFFENMYEQELTVHRTVSTRQQAFDFYTQPESLAAVRTFLDTAIPIFEEYDVLAFSLFSYMSSVVFEVIIDYIKERIDKPIIVGGNHLCFKGRKEKFLKYTPYVCDGPGEKYFQELYNLTDFKLYSYNQYFDDYAIEQFKKGTGEKPEILYSSFCVNKCSYCINSKRPTMIPERDHLTVLKEIIYLKSLGFKAFFLDCENIANNYKGFNTFIGKLKFTNHKGSGMMYSTNLAPFNEHGITYKDIDIKSLVASGCGVLNIGVESFSESLRDKMNKPKYSNDELFEFFEYMQGTGIKLIINLITGFYNETEEEHIQSINEYKRFHAKFGNCFSYSRVAIHGILAEEEMTGCFANGDKIQYDDQGFWCYGSNTIQVRKRRFKEFKDLFECCS